MITIRRAELTDIPNIMDFFDKNWAKGHILARDRHFFEWMYVEGQSVNFYIGVDEQNKIYGMVGFIRYNHSQSPDISGTTWKTIKSENPVLGLDMERRMLEELNVRYCCSAGISGKARKIYNLLGGVVRKMSHYYRLNDLSSYVIAKVDRKEIPEAVHTGYRLEKIYRFEEVKKIIPETMLERQPLVKDHVYLNKRYFLHPVFKYDIWKITDEEGKANSILITRQESHKNAKMCKIIDFYGRIDDLPKCTEAIDKLLKERGYEYIDIYSFGVPEEIYKKAGFTECKDDSNIIPNYFAPFERRNIDLYLIDPFIEGIRIFRGDGDQDRPN